MTTNEVNFWNWLVSKLPAKLVYFCFIRVWSEAESDDTCGKAVTAFSTKHNIQF